MCGMRLRSRAQRAFSLKWETSSCHRIGNSALGAAVVVMRHLYTRRPGQARFRGGSCVCEAPAMTERRPVPLTTVAREWTRIGVTGLGGPPAHIGLLRQLVVERRHWLDAETFEDANAACGLLPGPASTQLAILCASRIAGPAGG